MSKQNSVCIGATVIVGFLVIFFGVWAGEEAFNKNHSANGVSNGAAAQNPGEPTLGATLFQDCMPAGYIYGLSDCVGTTCSSKTLGRRGKCCNHFYSHGELIPVECCPDMDYNNDGKTINGQPLGCELGESGCCGVNKGAANVCACTPGCNQQCARPLNQKTGEPYGNWGVCVALADGGDLKSKTGVCRLQEEASKYIVSTPTPGPSALFRHSSFVLAHDAATGYVRGALSDNGQGPLPEASEDQVKAQWGDFAQQLTCGARALDLRLGYFKDNPKVGDPLYFHHGNYYFGYDNDEVTVQKTLPSIVAWAQKNPAELVVLVVSHCWGKFNKMNCRDSRFSTPFKNALCPSKGDNDSCIGITFGQEWLKSLTMKEAKHRAKLPNGGMVLVVSGGDIDTTYSGLYGAGTPQSAWPVQASLPYGISSNPLGFVYHWKNMFQYFNWQLQNRDDKPWMLQAIWQENIESTVTDIATSLTDFSIVGQTIDSNLNQVLLNLANGGFFNGQTRFKSPTFKPNSLGLGPDCASSLVCHGRVTTGEKDEIKSESANWIVGARTAPVNFLLMNMVADGGYKIAAQFGAKNPKYTDYKSVCEGIVKEYKDGR